MSLRALMVLLVLAGVSLASSPNDATAAAVADLVRYRPVDGRGHQRYLWLPPGTDWKAWERVLGFWVNSLSREAELVPLARVRHDLLRLDLRAYGLPAGVWERLADVDPYFHVQIKLATDTVVRIHWPGGLDPRDGRNYRAGVYDTKKRAGTQIAAHAPWLDAGTIGSLATLARSEAPIVRGDWWLVQSSQQADRQGTGYYDWLQIKNRRDFQTLVGLNEKLAIRVQRELRAIVTRSGVALNNRQIARFGTVLGGYWVTLDSLKSTGKNNAARLLNGDYQHDAEEIISPLPNGLHGFFLGNNQGVRQDAAPDGIASDSTAPGNDRRVHVGISCVRCHVEGIRPVDDWGRRVYRPPLGLGVADYERFQRLRRLYLSDLGRWVRRDQQDYADALFALTAMKPAEMARLMGRLWAQYQEADLSLADLARETGYTEAQAKTALQAVLTRTPPLDPVLAGLLAVPAVPVRREHAEEVMPLWMSHMRGHAPGR